MNDEGVTAILGLVLVAVGGEIRVPVEVLQNGLPQGYGVRVTQDPSTDELVVSLASHEAPPHDE